MFCERCGGQIENGVCTQFGMTYQDSTVQNTQQPFNANYSNSGFVEPDEKVIATIGNSFIENFFTSGFLGDGGATLTNKRFYYKGKAISIGSALIQKTKCIVELSEITAVEILHRDKLVFSIILAVIFQILAIGFFDLALVVGIICETAVVIAMVAGIMSIKNVLCVAFKGGSISFPIKLYGMAQCNEFLRQTLLARKAFIDAKNNSSDIRKTFV